jgi:hypothetical protein
MTMALVVHTFMTMDDHEWRYGHGGTLHRPFPLSFQTHLCPEECFYVVCIAWLSSSIGEHCLIKGIKVTYAGMART